MIGLDADLHAEGAGMRVRIDGRDSILTCRLEADAGNVLGALRRSRQLFSLVRAIVPILNRGGIRFDVVVGSVRIARIGSGVRQNAPARLLRLPSVHIGA